MVSCLRQIFFAISIALFCSPIFSKEVIYAFRDIGMPKNSKIDNNPRKEKMILIGETMMFDKVKPVEYEGKYKNVDIGYDTRPDIVTVKVNYDPGIRPGQILYLIEKDFDHNTYKDGNIVGQIEVKSVFQTAFIGKQLRGIGFLSMAKEKILSVAIPLISEQSGPALVERKKGDYHWNRNEIPEAIQAYRKAIRLDPSSPDAHFQLGLLYLKEADSEIGTCSGILPMSAGAEFASAWEKRARFDSEQSIIRFAREYVSFLNCKSQQAPSFKKGNPVPLELERAQEVARVGFQVAKEDYELLIRSAESYLQLYLSYAPKKTGATSSENVDAASSMRNRQEKAWEISEKLLKEASRFSLTDYRFHKLNALLYGKKFQSMVSGAQTSNMTPEASLFRSKTLEAIQSYKEYRPKNIPGDRDILVLEKDLGG
ncbi:hypothetical protein CH373_09245 [Leptospira perolatii]|uniref:Uncharacterized protein n=1 Tax=Leptospira perolatii TaxID=2023191 RepID=A0A2M9ZNV6_9LEPT|nr:tetratricopeptide repeat protein [Leptospira perolatii]PJZ69672.1 hypothetical protein CH360_10390 [Leptospira perolatii]PJZ73659.1 hypothetical protein CH373_09245 [Leptospira perolatii]